MEAIAVDIRRHPLTGVLGGAQAQTVQAEAEIIVATALGIFAAGVQLAKDQIPVPALLRLIVIDRNAAAEVLDLDDMVREQRDIDAVAWPSRASSMELEMISKMEWAQPSTPSEPKMTAGRLRTRSAPFSWRILSLPYSCCFFAMRRFPLMYIETVVVFAHIFLLNHSLEVFVKSTCTLRAGCRGRCSHPTLQIQCNTTNRCCQVVFMNCSHNYTVRPGCGRR